MNGILSILNETVVQKSNANFLNQLYQSPIGKLTEFVIDNIILLMNEVSSHGKNIKLNFIFYFIHCVFFPLNYS